MVYRTIIEIVILKTMNIWMEVFWGVLTLYVCSAPEVRSPRADLRDRTTRLGAEVPVRDRDGAMSIYTMNATSYREIYRKASFD